MVVIHQCYFLKLIFSEGFTHWYLAAGGRWGGSVKLLYFMSGKWLNFVVLYFQTENAERRRYQKKHNEKPVCWPHCTN